MSVVLGGNRGCPKRYTKKSSYFSAPMVRFEILEGCCFRTAARAVPADKDKSYSKFLVGQAPSPVYAGVGFPKPKMATL